MRGAQISQRLGQQAQRIKDSAVVRQGVLLIGPALNVLPGAGFDVLAGLLLVVGQAGQWCRCWQRRLDGLAQDVQACRALGVFHGVHVAGSEVSAHMRSRLW